MIELVTVHYSGTVGPTEPAPQGSYAYVVHVKGEKVDLLARFLDVSKEGVQLIAGETEYLGLIAALESLVKARRTAHHVRFYGDNLMIPNQLNGVWFPKNTWSVYHARAAALVSQFRDIHFTCIPKKENAEAREMAEKELLAHGIDPVRIAHQKSKEPFEAKEPKSSK